MANKFAVIVDAYSTGAKLASKFQAEGISVLHVQSAAPIIDFYVNDFRPDDFIANVIFTGLAECVADIDQVLNGAKPMCVLAGAETGIELADLLAAELGLPGNATNSSRVRRDKYAMASALQAADLATPHFLRTDSLDALNRWAADHCWPLVLKPLASAGNDSVFFCYDSTELKTAFQSIYNKANRFGGHNNHVLAQTLLKGTQYVINSVSIDGQHYISDMWVDRRKFILGASNIYDCEELLAYEGDVQGDLITYIKKALDALGVRNGPAHSEIMMTAEGPVLIETGARLQGAMLEEPVVEALGESQITLTIERYCHPVRFKRRLGQQYVLSRHVMCVAMISDQEGVVVDTTGFEQVCSLPSYACHFHLPEKGDDIVRTIDLFSIPGVVYLSHKDRHVLQRDYQTIRQLEQAHQVFTVHEKIRA
ncbi:ATP-grasp domain-containing protein [Pseudomonas fluorescens]|uniref:ATP-grasp domain-containing protein n=1 Tax=Pseudomonas TaxID=286 RepID=UPI00190860AB|nr:MULTISPECIES: ATP-grasp domain-containing protein [Pseudomonas]MBD8092942.1 ATP-grasp domain-containing protein [Pseudomonas fluorescens]MBD8718956.1 ATP-grasp domain-containing protein [Pseudomonas fluorescens]MDL2187130.1 ATP-grasp domain-containing protein [Pseudomonas sp. ChxA]